MNSPDELIERHLDGEATAEELRALSEWLSVRSEHRKHYLKAVAMHRQLREWALTETVRMDADKVSESRPRRELGLNRWFALAAMAAAVALLANIAIYRHTGSGRGEVELSWVTGAATWISDDGERKSDVRSGMRLPGGTLTVSGATSTAELVFRDGTKVWITGDTQLTFSDLGQKILHCPTGRLTSKVRPQPPGRPMIVRTATAEVAVVGTTLAIEAARGATSVGVAEGRVRVRRLVDSFTTDVSADERIVVDGALREHPVERQVTQTVVARWSAHLATISRQNWVGHWLPATDSAPARLESVPSTVGKRNVTVVRPIIKVAFDAPAELPDRVTLGPDSLVRLRVRGTSITRLWVFLSTGHPTGAFRGNFEIELPWSTVLPDAHGWRTLVVSLRGAVPKLPEFPDIAGSCLKFVVIDAKNNDAAFELSEFEILPGAR